MEWLFMAFYDLFEYNYVKLDTKPDLVFSIFK